MVSPCPLLLEATVPGKHETSVTWSECMVLISQTQPSSECPEIWTETT